MRRGFSLVESLIAMTILSIALLAMALVPVATTKLLASAARRERASALAVGLVEAVEAVSFDVLPALSTDVFDGFTRTLTVTKGDFSADIAVSVSWHGPTGLRFLEYRRQVSRYASRQIP